MQAWVSCFGCRRTACDPQALGGAQCGEQRGPDHKHSETVKLKDAWRRQGKKTVEGTDTACTKTVKFQEIRSREPRTRKISELKRW